MRQVPTLLYLLAVLITAGCAGPETAFDTGRAASSPAKDERVRTYRVEPSAAEGQPSTSAATATSSAGPAAVGGNGPSGERDWFDDHEQWKQQVTEFTDELLRELPEERAQQVKLARRVYSDGAFIEWLLGGGRHPASPPLPAVMNRRLRVLHNHWRSLESRLTSVPVALEPVTGPDNDRTQE